MYNTVIIDDEKRARETLKHMLTLYSDKLRVVEEANSVQSGIEVIRKVKPDLIFLDIKMPDGSGFDLLEKVDMPSLKVIFTTAYQQHAIEAFQFSAIDYLLKPINRNNLVKAIDKVDHLIKQENISAFISHANSTGTGNKKIILKTSDNIYLVQSQDIIRCESDSNYTTFYFNDKKKILVSKPLKEFDEMLSKFGFFRPHQSHLINMNYFERYEKADGGFLVMKDQSQIPVSRSKKDELMTLLEKF